MAFEHWYCEKCKRESTVQYKKTAGVYEVRNLIEFHHGRKSRNCAIQNGVTFVRLGFPVPQPATQE